MHSEGHLFYVLAHERDEQFGSLMSEGLAQIGHIAFTKPLVSPTDELLDENALAAMKASRGVIFFLSKASASDLHMERHLVVARQLNRPVVAVRLENVDDGPVLQEALGANRIDWYGPVATARFAINHLLPPQPPPPMEAQPEEQSAFKSSWLKDIGWAVSVALTGLLVILAIILVTNRAGEPSSSAPTNTTVGMNTYSRMDDLGLTPLENETGISSDDPVTVMRPATYNGIAVGGNTMGGDMLRGVLPAAEPPIAPLPPLLPMFAQFSVARSSGRAPLQLSVASPHWLFRTRIREGYAEGPNFGSNDTLIGWGCGSGGCARGVIVDGATGSIFDWPFGGEEYPSMQLDFRRGSNLIRVTLETDGICTFEAWSWSGGRLNLVARHTSRGQCPNVD